MIFWEYQRKFKQIISISTHNANKFLFKLLHHELLTFHQCAKHRLDIEAYKDLKCSFYNTEMETLMHLLTCDQNPNLNIMKTIIMDKFKKKLRKRNITIAKLVDSHYNASWNHGRCTPFLENSSGTFSERLMEPNQTTQNKNRIRTLGT